MLQSSKGWIVLHSFNISTRILCEIATDRHLDKFHLTDEQIQHFTTYNYTTRREGASRGKLLTLHGKNISDFCGELLKIVTCYDSGYGKIGLLYLLLDVDIIEKHRKITSQMRSSR